MLHPIYTSTQFLLYIASMAFDHYTDAYTQRIKLAGGVAAPGPGHMRERITMIGQIELTSTEQELASKIEFVLDHRMDHEQVIENGERAAKLMQMLLKRKAIPEQRLAYLNDPEYNPGRGSSSRLEPFLRNAGGIEAVVRHPHFLPYLHYFIYGADLPAPLKQEFQQKAADYWVKPGDLAKSAKQLVRKYDLERPPLNYRLKDAFYQLALDCGCDEGTSRWVRDAVMKVK